MNPPARLVERIGSGTWTPVRGGDIALAWRVDGDDGGRRFVKHLPDAPEGFFAAEADGLAFLAVPGAVAVPEVLDHGDGPDGFIALEWIERGAPSSAADDALGRGLARLHATRAPGFGGAGGLAFLGSVRVDGAPVPSWAELWADRRLVPLARRALDSGGIDAATAARVEGVAARIETLAGPPEPPARVHGDLWSGNAMVDVAGVPWLIDPAAHGGHRETDLAMMRLFGGFSEGCFAAYAEVRPLADGWEQRVPLHQLVPVLVHVILFGGSYRSSLDGLLTRLGA